MRDPHAVSRHLVDGCLERTQEFRQILLIDVGDVHMLRVLGNGFGIELDGVHYLDGIGSECPQEQFRVVEGVKVVDRIGGAELDALDLLQIDIKDLLGIGSCAAKAHTVKGFLDRIPQIAIEERWL